MKKKIIVFGSMLLIGIAAKSSCCAAEMLQRTNFNEGINLPWHVWEEEKGSTSSTVKNGEYSVALHSPGTNTWDIALRHNEISIKKGHKYNVKFSLKSLGDCKVYARIGEAIDPYNDAWNNNYSAFDVKGMEILEVTDSFVAEKDFPNAEFAFWIGGSNAGKNFREIDFISMSLDDPQFVPTPASIQTKYDIRVNQLGYYTNAEKKAILNCKNSSIDTYDCVVIDKKGKVVHKCCVTPYGKDLSSGDVLNIIDFSDFKTSGTGYTICCGDSKSLPFDIGSDIYASMKYDALKYFYHSRSGTEITLPYCVESKWARSADSLDDKAKLKEDNVYKGPPYINATGGWFSDDHGKHMVNGGLALWLLQNQYEFDFKKHEDARFGDGKLNIPESGNNFSDLLDEARWQMEWMLKMQIPEGYDRAGMAAHKVSDEWINSIPKRLERFYYPPSTAATLNLAACGAQAARLWKDIDTAFSDKCLAAAETAWNAALESPAVFVTSSSDPESEIYKDNYVEDEFYWAGCELYLTTKNSKYLEKIQSSECFCKMPINLKGKNEGIVGAFDWSTTSALGTLSLALVGDLEFPQAIESILNTANIFSEIGMKEGYRVTLATTTFFTEFKGHEQVVVDGYPEFSNQIILNNAIILAYAWEFNYDSKYLAVARDTLDYLCGRNPNNKCYVTGYGINPVKSPYQKFDTYAFEPTFPNVQKGFVVSGPCHTDLDPWFYGGGAPKSIPALKDYYDDINSRLTNRVSASLNAALAWMTEFSDRCSEVEYRDASIPTPTPTTPQNTTPTPTTTPTIHKEDINNDGCVNMIDVMAIAHSFGAIKTDARFDSKCDLNNDGGINMADVVYIAKFFGNTYID